MKGVLSPALITDLRSLAVNKEEELILGWLAQVTSRYLFLNKLRLVLFAFNSFTVVIIFIFSNRISDLPVYTLAVIFVLVLSLGLFAYFLNTFGVMKMLNTYTRISGNVFDNILQSIYDSHTVSLARLITKFPTPKSFSEKLSSGALASSNYYLSQSQIIGVFAALVISFVYGFIFSDRKALIISIYGLTAILLFYAFLQFGRKYIEKEKELTQFSDYLDQAYKDREALIFSGKKIVDKAELWEKMSQPVRATTYINAISGVVYFVFPILFIFYPMIPGVGGDLFVVTSACLFITMRIFGQTAAVSNYNAAAVADTRVNQLNSLIKTISKTSAELTPKRYFKIKKNLRFAKSNRSAKSDALVAKGLKYLVGRGDNEKVVKVQDMKLKRGKVHFVYGKSGSGKSIFGRVLSLRYSSFEAKQIEINGKDIRSFSSLQEGLLVLHFSTLRHISTSYRNALSMYLRTKSGALSILEYIKYFEVSFEEVQQFFADNYDTNSKAEILRKLDRLEVTKKLKQLNEGKLEEISALIRNGWKNVEHGDMATVAAFIEYTMLRYLKIFIPEANLYFMDAVLSEPPISQGQRRRVLLALDLLVSGKLFVADEPFSNLDDESSGKAFKLLEEYAKRNKAVVIVLDQKRRFEYQHEAATAGQEFVLRRGRLVRLYEQ